MVQRLKAIPTTYKGIEFRSKLEAKYAQAFDRLGIVWEYEGHGFRFDDGTCYAPDFYMPEIDTYFEVKGVMDYDSIVKVLNLAKAGRCVVVGYPDGKMEGFNGSKRTNWWAHVKNPSDLTWDEITASDYRVCKCAGCLKNFFLSASNSYVCPSCGTYDGDHHLLTWEENLFEAAGW